MAPSHEPDIQNTSDLVKRFLICIYLMVEYHASRIDALIVSLEGILYYLGTLLALKMISTIYLDLHVLKFNPLLNIKVPIAMLIFFMIY